MGLPSILPIRIPSRVRKGEVPKARDYNDLVDAVRALVERGWSSPPISNPGSDPLQFKIYAVRYDSTEEKWYCKVRPGWVRNRNPDSAATDVIKDWMPEAGDPAVALDAAEPPEIEIANAQTVYCRVTTTDKGIIETAPTIEAAATPTNGTHFQPPNAAANGDLYFPLCNVTITGDPAVVTLEQIQQGGPIHVTPNLPEIRNVGEKREVFKAREPSGDTYDFRTLEQLGTESGGTIAHILRPLAEEEEEGDTIPVRAIRKNNGSTTPYTITGTGDNVDFEFTGSPDTYFDPFGGSIEFVDGLAKLVTQPDAPEGKDLNLTFLRAIETGFGSGNWSTEFMSISYWRKGLYVGEVDPDDGDPPAGLVEKDVIAEVTAVA